MRATHVLTIAIGLIVPGAALAASPIRVACQIQTLCPGVAPGHAAIMECLREHKAELSQDCKIAIADRMLNQRGKAPPAGNPPSAGPGGPAPGGPGPAPAEPTPGKP